MNRFLNLNEIIIKTFLIVFRQIYTITYRLFKRSMFNAFVKLTKCFRQIDESCYISFRHLSNSFANEN